MKQFYVTFLFFILLCTFICQSCVDNVGVKQVQKNGLDSLSIFMENMSNNQFSDSIHLIFADKTLDLLKDENDTLFAKTLNYKIQLLGQLKKYDEAILNSKLLLNESEKNKDSVFMGKASYNLAYYFSIINSKDSAYHYFNFSKNIYNKLNDNTAMGYVLTNIAIIQSDFGDYEASDVSAIEALKYLENSTSNYKTSIYNCLAINSRNQDDYNDAIYYYEKAIENTINIQERFLITNNIANAYKDLNKFDKSITILDNINKDSITSESVKAKIIDNLAYIKWLDNPDVSVLKDFTSALKIRTRINDRFGLIASYDHLSDYYMKRNPVLAQNYALKMSEISKEQKRPEDQLKALNKLIKLDKNPSRLKQFYDTYIHLTDSIKIADRQTKNKYAKIKFDSEKNREENLQLKIDNAEKQLKLNREKNRNTIGALSSMLVILGLILFVYYRKKKHTLEKREEAYKTEIRIAKKLHDDIANGLFNVMNNLQYSNKSIDELLDDLDKIYLLTRNISHQNSIIETGNNFETFLKTMLNNFNTAATKVALKGLHESELNKLSAFKQKELYRILFELMVNMQKHSKANNVVITFEKENSRYKISYADNGAGMDKSTFDFGAGLKNVENRIDAINGTINFDTDLNKGFKVNMNFNK